MNIKDQKKIERLLEIGMGISKGKELKLNTFEVQFCIDKKIEKFEPPKFSKEEKNIYSVYKQLREKGYNMRISEDSDLLRVYQKGFRPGEDRTKYLMKIIEKWPEKKEIEEYLKIAGNLRKELIFALIGKKIEFIKLSRTNFD